MQEKGGEKTRVTPGKWKCFDTGRSVSGFECPDIIQKEAAFIEGNMRALEWSSGVPLEETPDNQALTNQETLSKRTLTIEQRRSLS